LSVLCQLSIDTNGIPGFGAGAHYPLNFSVCPNPVVTDTARLHKILDDGHTKLGIVTDNRTKIRCAAAVTRNVITLEAVTRRLFGNPRGSRPRHNERQQRRIT
jgi:hypothetical protein